MTARDDGNSTLQQSSREQIRGLAAYHVIQNIRTLGVSVVCFIWARRKAQNCCTLQPFWFLFTPHCPLRFKSVGELIEQTKMQQHNSRENIGVTHWLCLERYCPSVRSHSHRKQATPGFIQKHTKSTSSRRSWYTLQTVLRFKRNKLKQLNEGSVKALLNYCKPHKIQ